MCWSDDVLEFFVVMLILVFGYEIFVGECFFIIFDFWRFCFGLFFFFMMLENYLFFFWLCFVVVWVFVC